jgi:hypothetical protein
VATLWAKLNGEGHKTRRCDKSCYGSEGDGQHCQCICGGTSHGQGLIKAIELTWTDHYPAHGNSPDYYFNLDQLKQERLPGESASVTHALKVREFPGGFVARCACGIGLGAKRSRDRLTLVAALTEASRAYDQHLTE